MSIPCGFTSEGLPVGLQVVGPRLREDLLLRFAASFGAAHPEHFRTPEIDLAAAKPIAEAFSSPGLVVRQRGPPAGLGRGSDPYRRTRATLASGAVKPLPASSISSASSSRAGGRATVAQKQFIQPPPREGGGRTPQWLRGHTTTAGVLRPRLGPGVLGFREGEAVFGNAGHELAQALQPAMRGDPVRRDRSDSHPGDIAVRVHPPGIRLPRDSPTPGPLLLAGLALSGLARSRSPIHTPVLTYVIIHV